MYSSATLEALAALAARQRGPQRSAQPLAIVGSREATTEQAEVAYRIARALAGAGMAIVCGGKIGVMEGAARGARDAGGICIGLLPEEEATYGNPYLTVALPTGMGLARNMLVARTASCLVAIGGGLGTISEMAMALQWGKPVFGLRDAPPMPGATSFETEDALLRAVAGWLLHQHPAARSGADLGG